jgi:type II secretory pathway predicted ATPase ExeA
MDMVTYVIMGFAVALLVLLAWFTGGMPGPTLSNPCSGSREREDADAHAAGDVSCGGFSVERKLPSEILDAAAQAEHLGTRSQAQGQLRCRDCGGQPASLQVTDLGRLVLAGARSRLLAEIVDSLLQGTQFLTLTGAHGVGKTTMAVAIREELSKRSVSVRWVDGRGGSGIHLRAIMFQILGEPQADVDDDVDIERLFDAMTEREAPIQRWVLIIDDAERLLPAAIGYLRLLASVAMERMPQIVFVGDPSFWDIARQAAQAGFEDLITARFELEPLSPRESFVAAQRLMSALSPVLRPVFDRDALETVIQRTDGLVGRLFPLVTAINAIATETDQTRVTTALIDAAAARLESRIESLAPPSAGNSEAAITAPVLRVAKAIAAARSLVSILSSPRREWGIVRMSGAAAAVVAGLGSATYWLAPFGIDRIWAEARTAALEDRNATGTASADPAIIIRLPFSTPMLDARLTSNSDGPIILQISPTAATPDIIESPAILVPQIAAVASAHRPATGRGTVRARLTYSAYATPASKGVWLFPPNSNGGANG